MTAVWPKTTTTKPWKTNRASLQLGRLLGQKRDIQLLLYLTYRIRRHRDDFVANSLFPKLVLFLNCVGSCRHQLEFPRHFCTSRIKTWPIDYHVGCSLRAYLGSYEYSLCRFFTHTTRFVHLNKTDSECGALRDDRFSASCLGHVHWHERDKSSGNIVESWTRWSGEGQTLR